MSSQCRTSSAPPATLYYVVAAHQDPFGIPRTAAAAAPPSGRVGGPPSPNSAIRRSVPLSITSPLYALAMKALPNVRAPSPLFAPFPFREEHLEQQEPHASIDSKGSDNRLAAMSAVYPDVDGGELVGGAIRPRLELEEARVFHDCVKRRLQGKGGADGRWVLANAARSNISKQTKGIGGSSTSSGGATSSTLGSEVAAAHPTSATTNSPLSSSAYKTQTDETTLQFFKQRHEATAAENTRLRSENESLCAQLELERKQSSIQKENYKHAMEVAQNLQKNFDAVTRETVEQRVEVARLTKDRNALRELLAKQHEDQRILKGDMARESGQTCFPSSAEFETMRDLAANLEKENNTLKDRLGSITTELIAMKRAAAAASAASKA